MNAGVGRVVKLLQHERLWLGRHNFLSLFNGTSHALGNGRGAPFFGSTDARQRKDAARPV